ncbi:MAG: hypothetical protein DRJ03_14880 [Chloroflexi bacterium]|nr:MAG: hypothetical protein DRJ03_14880 [Chloroflexota bacterium]
MRRVFLVLLVCGLLSLSGCVWGPEVPPPELEARLKVFTNEGSLMVTLDGSESVIPFPDATSITYLFGDGTEFEDAPITVTHEYEEPGCYTATLILKEDHPAKRGYRQDSDSVQFCLRLYSGEILLRWWISGSASGKGTEFLGNELVTFDAEATLHTAGLPLTFRWDIVGANVDYYHVSQDPVFSILLPCPPHTCNQPCPEPYEFEVKLQVWDSEGQRVSDSAVIRVRNPAC